MATGPAAVSGQQDHWSFCVVHECGLANTHTHAHTHTHNMHTRMHAHTSRLHARTHARTHTHTHTHTEFILQIFGDISPCFACSFFSDGKKKG